MINTAGIHRVNIQTTGTRSTVRARSGSAVVPLGADCGGSPEEIRIGRPYSQFMATEVPKYRRVKLVAEAIVEIRDQEALEEAGLKDIDSTDFMVERVTSTEEARALERESITGDPVSAVGWLAGPVWMVVNLPGTEIVTGTLEVQEVDEDGSPFVSRRLY